MSELICPRCEEPLKWIEDDGYTCEDMSCPVVHLTITWDNLAIIRSCDP